MPQRWEELRGDTRAADSTPGPRPYLISQPVPDDAFHDLLSQPVLDAVISA